MKGKQIVQDDIQDPGDNHTFLVLASNRDPNLDHIESGYLNSTLQTSKFKET